MRADDRALADVAASVADGEPVNWQAAESRAGAPERRLVRHLRLVESIASLYRSIPPEDDTDAGLGINAAAAEAGAPAVEPSGPPWGRLIMFERIGHGTSCHVFRAWDTELHREVALKVLHDEPRGRTAETHARVLQEARRLARIRHPHVVQVYGAERHDGQVGLWMELVRGESLERIVAARGPFGPGEAAVVGQDLCGALAAVHGAGLLHRDVKAQNVLRESGGRTVLMDFGTGEELQNHAGTARLAGTPLYLAPEVFRGQAASVQSDLYALGVLLFYLVTGQFPVMAGSIEQLSQAHASGRTRRLRDLRADLPSAFVRAVERAIDPDPAARYRTAGEMEAALRESADRFHAPAVDAGRGWAALGRIPVWARAAAALLLAVAVGAIVWSRAADRGGPVSSRAVTSIAVLPLADVSGPSPAPYLADALTDQLITTLGQVSSLRVTSRTSVLQFKDQPRAAETAAHKMGVDAVIEGTVAVVGGSPGDPGRVRVNARLIAATGGILWARTFERPMGDTLALEADLARAIAEGVHAAVTPAEERRLTQIPATTANAERAYLQGVYLLNQLGADNLRAAIEALKRATELDSNYAPAYAALARAHITMGFMSATSHNEARASALAAASRAAALDAESSAAHEVLADLKFYYDWDWAGAESGYQKAIELNPSSARAHSQYARYLSARARHAAALREAAHAVSLDQFSAPPTSTLALVHYFARDYDRALETAARALQLDPQAAGVHFVQARIHAARGALPEAIAANERAIDLAGRPAVGWRAHLILLQARSGQVNEAREALADLIGPPDARKERIKRDSLAYVEAALGNRQVALQLLESAADDRDPDLLWIAVDPRIDPLRNEPRLQALVARLGLR